MNPIRVGLVGLGRAGTGMHFHELKGRQDKFHFAAVCDIIGERTEPFVKEFGVLVVSLPEKLPSLCANTLKIL